jgi:lactate dehydrogenase-like 2-hydroxyacid dehydrogenase
MQARNITAITAAVRSRPWDEARRLGGAADELEGMTAGIVGVGEIGRRVAKICRQDSTISVRPTRRLPPGWMQVMVSSSAHRLIMVSVSAASKAA